ncbi:MAG: trigger factor [Patescibacteria group bacterium]
MNSTKTVSSDGTIELTFSIPWKTMEATYEVVIDDFVKNAELSGFRKGKAPRKMVEDSLNRNTVYEEAIKRLVPKYYADAIEEHKIKPILMPQIELKEAKENSDWVVSAKTCQRPIVEVCDYKKVLQELKANKDKKPTLDDILTKVLSVTKATIPMILVEHEVTHQLSQLVDQTKKLGLTVEQYLASTNRTADSVRQEYSANAIRALTLEFTLEVIADTEKITVDDADLAKILATAKTDAEKKQFEEQKYYLVNMLRRQKTIDFLSSL